VLASVIEKAYFILLQFTPFRCFKVNIHEQQLLLLAFDARYVFIQIFYASQAITAFASNFLGRANAHQHVHTYRQLCVTRISNYAL